MAGYRIPTPGEVFEGKYRVERMLGEGGMGVVVEATHLMLQRRVALKFPHPQLLQRPEAMGRFIREARCGASIQSEHIGRVLDVSEMTPGVPYIVMELVPGIDLAEALARRGALDVDEAVSFVLQACEPLAEAHALGIVHRDLKPSNLFLTRRADGTPLIKVFDFGISKRPRRDTDNDSESTETISLTYEGALLGSPIYMAPEQILNAKGVDARADVWSLGVVLYELLLGRTPFTGNTVEGIMAAIRVGAPRVSALRPEVPAVVEEAIAGCLEPSLGKRTPNVAELARGLAPAAWPSARRVLTSIVRIHERQAAGLPDLDEDREPARLGSLDVTPLANVPVPLILLGGGEEPEEPTAVMPLARQQAAAGSDRPASPDKAAAGSDRPGAPEMVAAGSDRPASPDKAASFEKAAATDRPAAPDKAAAGSDRRAAGSDKPGAPSMVPAGSDRPASPDKAVAGSDRPASPDKAAAEGKPPPRPAADAQGESPAPKVIPRSPAPRAAASGANSIHPVITGPALARKPGARPPPSPADEGPEAKAAPPRAPEPRAQADTRTERRLLLAVGATFLITFGGTWLANALRPPATINVYNSVPAAACPEPATSSAPTAATTRATSPDDAVTATSAGASKEPPGGAGAPSVTAKPVGLPRPR